MSMSKEEGMDISQATCPDCGKPMRIRQTGCNDCGVALEADIEVSPLGRLPLEDQAFVTAFVRHHGSIKKMEALFDISYPTVKNRLNAIVSRLDRGFDGRSPNSVVLEQLARGEISVDDALERLS
jgi:hypothetical protein